MADDVLPETGSENSSEEKVKCCTKPCAVYVCVICLTVYHKSCAKKFTKIEYIGENKVICCDKRSEVITENNGELRYQQIKNKYLKELLEEVKDKNKVLQMNNDLLLQRITSLEGQLKVDLINRNDSSNSSLGEISNVKPLNETRIHGEKTQTQTLQGPQPITNATLPVKTSISNSHTIPMKIDQNVNSNNTQRVSNFSYSRALRGNQSDRQQINRNMNVIKNNENGNNNYQLNANHTFTTRKAPVKNIGTGRETSESTRGFIGTKRRVWLYIYRVARTATAKMINEYLVNERGLQEDEVQVQEMPSESNNKKRFVVTGPMEKKDEMYKPEFWPEGVGIKRFDFQKHRDFLNEKNFL